MLIDFAALRKEMVYSQLINRGIYQEEVLRAMDEIPREKFVLLGFEHRAYEDNPLPIECDQTISQPYIVALMVQLGLEKTSLRRKALEIGAGSGYAAAVLSRIFKQVYAVERIPQLAKYCQDNLCKAKIINAFVEQGDGTSGWIEQAPFDLIIVSAAAPQIPHSLKEQMAINGVLIIPLGDLHTQNLIRVHRVSQEQWYEETTCSVRFVPCIGKEGWPES